MKNLFYWAFVGCVGLLFLSWPGASVLGQVVFFDNFQQFANGTDLTATNYSPASGPPYTSVITSNLYGSTTIKATNFLGDTWAFFDNSIPTNKNQYKANLFPPQAAQAIEITWKMWIQKTNSGTGGLFLSVPTTDPINNYNPPISFMDSGAILALTNGTSQQTIIGNWGALAGTVMTNSLVLDYPDQTFSYTLNGSNVATLPLGAYFDNNVQSFFFNGFEGTPDSRGNRFAVAEVKAQETTSIAEFSYITNNNTITITGFSGTESDVAVPSFINNFPVTAIGDYAFGSWWITTLSIPNSVSTIGFRAFSDSTGLTNISLGNGVTSIGGGAFQSCGSLATLVLPNSVTNIGASAFSDSGLGSIIIPDSVTTLGDSAFFSCTNLTNIVIGSGVTVLGDFTFSYCSSLRQVTIPDNVVTLGDTPNDTEVFAYCSNLTSVTIGNGVTSIGVDAFYICPNLVNVLIGNSVSNIGAYAFSDCGLTNVSFPNSVANIGPGAFTGCPLTSVVIPNNVQTVGTYAFDGCPVTSVVIGNSITNIGDFAFYGCTNLEYLAIGNSIVGIGSSSFYHCTNLKTIFFTGNAPMTVSPGAFQGDANATVYYLPGASGWGMTYVYWPDFLPVVQWKAQLQITKGAGPFSFNIAGTSNLVVVIEATSNLFDPVWIPLSTNKLTNGTSLFTDPQSANYPGRFYRIRLP